MIQPSLFFLYTHVGKIGVTAVCAIPGCVLLYLAVKKYIEQHSEKIPERSEHNDGPH